MECNVSCKDPVGDRPKNKDQQKVAANRKRRYIIDDKVEVPRIVLWQRIDGAQDVTQVPRC